ncbi:hypothetical protein M2244_002910 [Rhodoferax antarcticus]|uniref:Uncharacterized protein n=1 Tax=Rhodoferax antarcticus ANT.BR TaxID=1111071 RepID=A0A1Q8YC04_9BURK|nr:hypothetical protein [Rhodoferax antarcticus]OLP05523.1 hypothetical protein BLL52_3190 [Rhodoferax antarcticus ANT.BR]
MTSALNALDGTSSANAATATSGIIQDFALTSLFPHDF